MNKKQQTIFLLIALLLTAALLAACGGGSEPAVEEADSGESVGSGVTHPPAPKKLEGGVWRSR